MTGNELLPVFPPSGETEPKLPGGGMPIPIFLFLLSIYFWEAWPVYPVKILTVFFHELSHGLAAVLPGGYIERIVINADQSGVCWTLGGNRLLVLSAGYLGSLLWGSAIFISASRTRFDREIVQGLGALLIIVTLVFIRNLAGIGFGLGFGIAMLAFANQFGEVVCDQFLRYLGMTSSFYVILDIKGDLIDHAIAGSDASKMGEMLGGLPSWLVGGVWFIIALVISYKALTIGWKEEETPRVSST